MWRGSRRSRRVLPFASLLALLLILIPGLDISSLPVRRAQALGTMTVEILAGYNLVVDSNATSPSTAAPSVATVAGRFCNPASSGVTLTNVIGYIGNYTSTSSYAQGVYPARDSSLFPVGHPLKDTGEYFYSHLGGGLGLADAARAIGTLRPGECGVQYWHFTYPQCSEADRTPPCSGIPVWGDSVKPEDDLWLEFDIWGTSNEGATANDTQRMTMRNEISAMANKIKPNPDGQWFNTKSNVVQPGGLITSNGILYELGLINQGFDNNGDYIPDYNAWMQPVGDASYDPGCFRLIHTSGILTVSRSAGKPDMVVHFEDQLYFTDLPSDNTGVRGEVYYTFLALAGPCATTLSPYQEVASGYDNEKFNADFGVAIPAVGSSSPKVTVSKTAPGTIAEATLFAYTIPFQNTSPTATAGLVLSTGGTNMPLVIEDTVPAGLQYKCGSATATLNYTPGSSPGYVVRYSTDSGNTWSTSEPSGCPGTNPTSTAPNNLIVIQWWLTDPLPTSTNNGSGTATFQALVPGGYINGGGSPVVENCAEGSFGAGSPFAEACDTTLVQGNNSIGDFVWRDLDGDGIQDGGSETGIANIEVYLYYDQDGDGVLDDSDPLMAITTTNGSGGYVFPRVPDGRYLVTVDTDDSNLPTGYTLTTREILAYALDPGHTTTNPVNETTADFGFGPSLIVEKVLTTANPAYVGEEVVFRVDLRNTLAGDGTEDGYCQYWLWANTVPATSPPTSGSGNAAFLNPGNAQGLPDGLYSTTDIENNTDSLGLGGFNTGGKAGTITKVETVIYVKETKDLKALDNIIVYVYHNGSPIRTTNHYGTAFTRAVGSLYAVRDDVTAARTWVWSDFVNDLTEMQVEANKGGGAGSTGDIGLDAVAYIVTTGERCNGADKTISYLPLTDSYDPARLDYASAVPVPAQVNQTAGVITWTNLGPLYAGGTRFITVTFRALATASPTTNTADVSGPRFSSGRYANDGSDDEPVTINASGSIAGTVWADTNNDGWQGTTGYNSGDTRIANVKVELYACVDKSTGLYVTLPPPASKQDCTHSSNNGEWRVVATAYTDGSGDYQFTGLRDGFYNVEVNDGSTPTGFPIRRAEPNPAGNGSGFTCGTCDGLWNSWTAALETFNSVNNTSGSDNISAVSFGYRNDTQGAVTGYVWHDLDADGVWDSGEQPIAGVTVNLTCSGSGCPGSIPPVTSDDRGNYTFTGLPVANASYQVVVTPPSGMSQSGDPDVPGSNCGGSCDNQKSSFTVSAGEVKGPYNFGYTGGLDIGDTIYTDWDGDGTQDSGEEGIPNVTVYLFRDLDGDGVVDAGEPLLSTQTTNASGLYAFTNLPGNGTEYVVLVGTSSLPAGYTQTADPDATKDSKTSVTLSSSDVWTADFGYQPRGDGSIGDTVWRDADGDGVQDAGEAGISGVLVRLYQDQDGDGVLDAEDALVDSETTNASGVYSFTGLPAGNYIVRVDPSNFDSGEPLYGLTMSTGGTPYNVSQVSYKVALGDAEDFRDADFGFTSSAIGDLVWQDNDGDGNQEAGEPGIEDVRVWLYTWTDVDGDGVYSALTDTLSAAPIMTTTTDASGIYSFTGLAAGPYVVKVDTTTLPSGFTQTGDPDWTSVCSGARCDSASGVDLPLGRNDMSRDFGYRPAISLGDLIWLDMDQDGVQDEGERGIGGVVITLTLQGGTVFTTTTNSDGYYAFGNVPANQTHTVRIRTSSLPPGLSPTYDLDGGNDHQASVPIGTTSRWDVDFGYWYGGTYTLGGDVFFDGDQDGNYYEGGPTDAPLVTITVYLYNSGGQLVATTQTDADGAYAFTNLAAGSFTIVVDTTSPKVAGMTPTTEPDNLDCAGGGTTCNNYTTVNTGDADAQNQDFGFYAEMDCGDLPNTYNSLSTNYYTWLSKEGPCHIMGNHRLGTLWDAEPDGIPDDDAGRTGGGDDGDASDDEDGIIPVDLTSWTGGSTVEITMTAVEGSNAYLVGWFDWNDDRDFIDTTNGGYDTGEYVFFGQVASTTTATRLDVQIPDPCAACAGMVLNARFRLYEGHSPPPIIAPTGIVRNGEVEDYQWDWNPTAVRLVSLSAMGQVSHIRVMWETATEVDNVGFYLYRRPAGRGDYAPLNDGLLIPSQSPGSGAGASYVFIDEEVELGVTYEYLLEDVDLDGVRTAHGPVMASLAPYSIFLPLVHK